MRPAQVIVLAAALAVMATAESKVVSGKKDDSSGQTLPGTRPSDSGSDGNPPAADTGPSGEVRAATALQPQFVVPDNGEPVGLLVNSGVPRRDVSGDGDTEPTVASRGDGSAFPGRHGPSAAARTDLYGLLSGPEVTARDAEQSAGSLAAQRRSGDASARRSLAESGPRSRGRLLSLIDGVYQESLDRDGNTTYITPLDRVSEEPFELSVRRYSRFVESRAQRGGRMHAEEDLEDLLQRLRGRLNLQESNGNSAGESEDQQGDNRERSHTNLETSDALVKTELGEGNRVDESFDLAPLILFNSKSDTGSPPSIEQTEQINDIKYESDPDSSDEYYEDINADHEYEDYQYDTYTEYDHGQELSNNDVAENSRALEGLENKVSLDTDYSNAKAEQDAGFVVLPPAEKNERPTEGHDEPTIIESPFGDDTHSKESKSNIESPASTAKRTLFDEDEERENHVDTNEKITSRRHLNDLTELPDTLQPPLDDALESYLHFDPEAQTVQESVPSLHEHTDNVLVTAESVDVSDTEKHSDDDRYSGGTDETPRRLPEYETHAEISLRGGIESSDPEAEGYGPAKPSSIYKPGDDTELNNVTKLEDSDSEQVLQRAVTPRSLDQDISLYDSPPNSVTEKSSEQAEPRLIEPWEPPKQQPRIRIHLPFVQEETIIQFHPPDRHNYGPPKGVASTSSKPATHSSHPSRTRGSAPKTKNSPPPALRNPGRSPSDGHIAKGSPVPSQLLPKEHRVVPQRPQQVKRPRPSASVHKLPKPSVPASTHRPLAHTTPRRPVHKTHHRPTTSHSKPSLRPAWLDVPREVLPLAGPSDTYADLPYDPATELSFDPVQLTTTSPEYLPVYPPTHPHSAAHEDEEKSSYSQVEPIPTPHEPTHTVTSYVSPIPVKLKPTEPSSYVSLQPNPLYVSNNPSASPSYVPPTPSYPSTTPTPSYSSPTPFTSPKPVTVQTSPNPISSYASPTPSPSYVPPTPTPEYIRPHFPSAHASPVHPIPKPLIVNVPHNDIVHPLWGHQDPHPLPGHPESHPPVVLPPPAIRNYAVPSVDKLSQRPLPRVPAFSHIQGYEEPPGFAHPAIVPDVPPPHPGHVEQPVRNYVRAPSDKLVQKPAPPVAHTPSPDQPSHSVRNYVTPPSHELAQKKPTAVSAPHPPEVHTADPPVRNYAVTAKGHQEKRPHLVLAQPSHQAAIGHTTRNNQPRGDEADRRTAKQDAVEPHIVVGTLERPADGTEDASDNQLESSYSSLESEPRQTVGDDHELPQLQQHHQELEQNRQQHQHDKLQEAQQEGDDETSPHQLPEASFSDSHRPQPQRRGTTIIDVLEAADSRLLLKLMDLSGMRELLEDTGPYTLFAPSERALGELLHRLGGVDTILDTMGKDSLLKLLQYHVLRGYALLEDMEHELLARTLEGSHLRINRYDTYDNVYGSANVTTVNGERLVRAELAADNGLVHFIEGVLAPPPADLVRTLSRDPRGRFSVLIEAVKLAGLQEVLADTTAGPLTLLAPTNVAFTQLPAEQLRRLLRDRRRLRQLLLGHVLVGSVYSSGLQPFQELETLSGSTVRVFSDTVSMKVDNALVIVPDVTAGNGVVHAIDAVLGLPEER
ncbi:mediator of DNA damage checkpoint protein 1-like [Amphibalanus amphitrite]|uniref:mediator of DNA damage checkpoint protein 1-like n=1 Tax=Amphibalanus amphitrite TaxID=1232801 RepID=UPI001C91AB4C|nr:mediator of DNA damage checkpoint protein 1-like [Amphibalanus amphitrite]